MLKYTATIPANVQRRRGRRDERPAMQRQPLVQGKDRRWPQESPIATQMVVARRVRKLKNILRQRTRRRTGSRVATTPPTDRPPDRCEGPRRSCRPST